MKVILLQDVKALGKRETLSMSVTVTHATLFSEKIRRGSKCQKLK